MVQRERTVRRPRLYALTGLKVLAVVGVFLWHALPKGDLIDLGARGCELMFAASGFLVAYNRHEWFTANIDDAFRYLVSKVRKFYALYLVALVFALVVVTLEGSIAWSSPRTYLTLPFHIGMMQAWSHRMALGFNTPAWFLSALMVCYGVAPLLSQALKRAQSRHGVTWGSVQIFGVLLAARVFLEVCHALDPGLFTFSLHTNPVVRFLEFGMAYVLGAEFVRRDQDGALRVPAGADTVCCALFVTCAVVFDDAWPRAAFVLLALPVVCTLAAQTGPVGRLLASRPLQAASSIEMQLYLLHWACIHLVAWVAAVAGIAAAPVVVPISFALSVVASVAAKKLFPRVHPT